MPVAAPSSIPNPCRWDVMSAARELQMTKETLARKLNAAGQVPGADKRYSTRQFLDSVFGDAAGQRLRKTAAEARYWELKGAVLAGESLPRDLLTPALEQIFVVIRQLITGSSMTTVEKRDLCNTIATWPIAVRTVATKAAKQTMFAGVEETNGDGANGEAGEAEAEEAP
jgi:hypothetical protein